jgi:hypothetical protein
MCATFVMWSFSLLYACVLISMETLKKTRGHSPSEAFGAKTYPEPSGGNRKVVADNIEMFVVSLFLEQKRGQRRTIR